MYADNSLLISVYEYITMSSKRDFGLQKYILLVSIRGSVTLIDSLSGTINWKRYFNAGNTTDYFLQRSSQTILPPLLALIISTDVHIF